MELLNHELAPNYAFEYIRYEHRPVVDRAGQEVDGLHQTWIWLDNERQLNSYTTEAVKDLILAFRRASCERGCVAVIFTAVGSRSFCTGGNTAEYGTYYANRPHEYLQYMRLFNDMVTAILLCDKPVICRVNGMRIGGGQEIGMACDFSISGDHARFGQAGPVHGSAPDGGSTDFLHLYLGYAKAAESLVICGNPWSAHKSLRLGLLNEVVPVYRDAAGKFVPNPMVQIDRYVDEMGQIVHGEFKSGAALDAGKAEMKACTVDFSLLDAKVQSYVTTLLHTFPDCTRKSLESLRKKKLEHWQQNSETNRSWLSLNMNTEAASGFPAFHFGARGEREADFIGWRQAVAGGARIDDALLDSTFPPSAQAGWRAYRKGEL